MTLVFDKGSAGARVESAFSLANTVELEQSGTGWISALPWNQAPEGLRSRDAKKLTACSSALPGTRAASQKLLVHGKTYLCVLKHSSSFASEQLHSITTSMAKAMQALLAQEPGLRRGRIEQPVTTAPYRQNAASNAIFAEIADVENK